VLLVVPGTSLPAALYRKSGLVPWPISEVGLGHQRLDISRRSSCRPAVGTPACRW